MKIRIITFGKTKSKEIESLVDYYSLLASKYAKLEKVNLKDHEGKIRLQDVSKYLTSDSYTIGLTEKGNQLATMQFADKLNKFKNESRDITFLIGNAYGIEDELLKKLSYQLSLGKLTYPHEVAEFLLIEQLFRVLNVLAGGKYHKP